MFIDEKNIAEMTILPKLNANKSHNEMPLTPTRLLLQRREGNGVGEDVEKPEPF